MTRLRFAALVLVIVAGAIDWGMMIAHYAYDYDEVQRAHSIWMTSEGLRPYNDFFESHPPYFALLAPLPRAITDPAALLLTLRLIAAAGNLLFLAGLATLATMGGSRDRLPAILGTALVAFHPAVIQFLAEFRVDGWGYALAVWSIVWFLHSPRRWRCFGLGVGTGIATLLFCPKLALLPPLILGFDQLKARGSSRNILWAFSTYALGLLAAGGLLWMWLALNRIDVGLMFACVVRYNSADNSSATFGHGLLREIALIWTLSLPILAALVIWTIRCFRARSFPHAYPAALALWLLAQAMLVSYVYKQYYGPWFLFASGFFPFLYAALNTLPKNLAAAMLFGLCALSIGVSGASAYTWANSRQAQAQQYFIRILDAITEPEDRIVGPPPLHAIYRRDTFYVWFNTQDPARYETEKVMETIPQLRDFVSDQHYRAELEAHPPAVVVLIFDTYPRRQAALLKLFIREHRYVGLMIRNIPVALRPDTSERLARTYSLH